MALNFFCTIPLRVLHNPLPPSSNKHRKSGIHTYNWTLINSVGFPSGNLDLIKMPYLIFCTAHISNYKKGLQLFFYIIITTSLDLCIIRKGAIMRIFAITVCVEKIYTLKP